MSCCKASIIYKPLYCDVNRIVHSKNMLRKHSAAMSKHCYIKNRKGFTDTSNDECRQLVVEILDYAEYLRENNELHEFTDFIDTFMESL